MTRPYGLMADLHLHRWSKFATVGADGVSSRLTMLLGEIERCAKAVKEAGGEHIIIAGDVFHVRGSLAPSVLNPTIEMLGTIHSEHDVEFIIIPGNHDLEGKESTWIGAAVTALGSEACSVHDQATLRSSVGAILVPWIEQIDELKAKLESLAKVKKIGDYDLIIHAPIDGVLPHLSGGLDPAWLAELGFKRVFAGHYHHHKLLYDGSSSTYATDVYSIGALAHHTWSDVGSLAGFLVVHPERVERFASHLPAFVDVTDGMDEDEVAMRIDGNYARAKIRSSKMSDVEKFRTWLTDNGARGVEIITVREPVEARSGAIAASVAAGASIEASISDFVLASIDPSVQKEVELEALKTFAEATV